MSKYRSVATEIDGKRFDSKAEARRYQELVLLEKAGEIEVLRCQVRFPIEVNGKTVCTYIADFAYLQNRIQILEDVKGMLTPVYRLKKKLMKAVYGYEIKEVYY